VQCIRETFSTHVRGKIHIKETKIVSYRNNKVIKERISKQPTVSQRNILFVKKYDLAKRSQDTAVPMRHFYASIVNGS